MTPAALNLLLDEQEVLDAALGELQSRLPSGWTVNAEPQSSHDGRRADALVTLTAPDGRRARLCVEIKRTLATNNLNNVIEQLQTFTNALLATDPRTPAVPVVIARYLAPPQRRWLQERDISYADATGNLRITVSDPAVFLSDIGATKDPWRGPGRPKGNLKGLSAARVVRALVDFRPPYTVPTLMKLAGTPSGNTYRAVDFIEEQDLLVRGEGQILQVHWRALLERWSTDYGFSTLVGSNAYLAPRGLSDLMTRLANLDPSDPAGRYAVTGSLATPKWEAYAPAKNAMIYAEKPDQFAACMELRPVDAGANVIIARAAQTAAFTRAQRLDGTVIVAPSQAVVDLLGAPGRGPEEGRALLDWMGRNESTWRQ